MVKEELQNQLSIGTISISNLFTNKLAIPDFQRPYEWTEYLVGKLFEDIDNHFLKLNNKTDFYLGSILLHHTKGDVYNIIDGQQRLTTFLILDSILRGKNSWLNSGLKFEFHSNISVKNIIIIRNYVEQIHSQFKFTQSYNYNQIIEKIILNIVITKDENTAFQFFDSLNSKGKKLDTINILKSFHLREFKSEEQLQKNVAKSFDRLNAKIEGRGFKNNRIYSFDHFVNLLWLTHYKWTKGNFNLNNKKDIESYFKINAKSNKSPRHLHLYPSVRNMKNNEVEVNDDIHFFDSNIQNNNKDVIVDFNPLQPVQRGLGFFYSLDQIDKYFNILFVDCEIPMLHKINQLVKATHNDYFLHLYYICVLGYYIKFDTNQIDEFAFEVEQILGNKFVKLQSVKRQSPIVLLRDEINIVQLIYLNIDHLILIDELKKFKLKNRVLKIKKGKKQDVVTYSIDNLEYPSHTSRPSYIRLALNIYHEVNNEEAIESFSQINWNNIKSK